MARRATLRTPTGMDWAASTLELSVTDDDGGADVESVTVRVLTPEEALAEILKLLDAAIAGSSNGAVRAALERARVALVGHEGAQDGALRMLAQNQPDAAAGFVLQAIDWSQKARPLGVNVDLAIALMQQVYAEPDGRLAVNASPCSPANIRVRRRPRPSPAALPSKLQSPAGQQELQSGLRFGRLPISRNDASAQPSSHAVSG